jgi:hypothetical protein
MYCCNCRRWGNVGKDKRGLHCLQSHKTESELYQVVTADYPTSFDGICESMFCEECSKLRIIYIMCSVMCV